MSKPFQYLAVYTTNFIQNKTFKLVISPTKVDIFTNRRKYTVPTQTSYRFPKEDDVPIMHLKEVVLENNKHIAIATQTRNKDILIAKQSCENEIDRMVTLLSMIYRPEIFDRLIYRGWIVENQWGVMDAWIDPATHLKPLHFDKTLVYNQITSAIQSIQQKNISERLNLMARFWAKAQSYDLSEEKFILLWTILEIYPMMDTTNIKPIYTILSKILGIDSELIEAKLGIRQLYRQRCDLVHQGKFTTQAEEIIELFDKLENIIYETIRNLIDLPYNHSLNHYL